AGARGRTSTWARERGPGCSPFICPPPISRVGERGPYRFTTEATNARASACIGRPSMRFAGIPAHAEGTRGILQDADRCAIGAPVLNRGGKDELPLGALDA